MATTRDFRIAQFRPTYSVAVLLVDISGVVLVRDEEHEDARWKLPGGHENIEDQHSRAKTAARELWEETGAVLEPKRLHYLLEEDRRTHEFSLLGARVPSAWRLGARIGDFGLTGERVRFARFNELAGVIELDSHRRLIVHPKVQRFLAA